MRPPARIKTWLSQEQMHQWLQDAVDEPSYRRRMAIWLTHVQGLHAYEVAESLGVSTQAVWLWIAQYNSRGPRGLERKSRGGRRWGFMTPKQESDLVRSLTPNARSGSIPRASMIKRIVEQQVGRKVSLSYIYRLLYRNGLHDVVAQSRSDSGKSCATQDSFQQIARPWLRRI